MGGCLCKTTSNDLKRDMNNIIYSISCEYNVQCIGESGKPLHIQIGEHKKNIKNYKTDSSR